MNLTRTFYRAEGSALTRSRGQRKRNGKPRPARRAVESWPRFPSRSRHSGISAFVTAETGFGFFRIKRDPALLARNFRSPRKVRVTIATCQRTKTHPLYLVRVPRNNSGTDFTNRGLLLIKVLNDVAPLTQDLNVVLGKQERHRTGRERVLHVVACQLRPRSAASTTTVARSDEGGIPRRKPAAREIPGLPNGVVKIIGGFPRASHSFHRLER